MQAGVTKKLEIFTQDQDDSSLVAGAVISRFNKSKADKECGHCVAVYARARKDYLATGPEKKLAG